MTENAQKRDDDAVIFALTNEAIDACNELSVCAERIGKNVGKSAYEIREALLDRQHALKESHGFDKKKIAFLINDSIVDFIVEMRRQTLFMYNTFNALPKSALFFEAIGEKKHHVELQNPEGNEVLVRLEHDAIFVKTPMLWSKNPNKKSQRLEKNQIDQRVVFFREAISNAFKTAPNFDIYDLSKYACKIIHFCYVYNDESAKKMMATDNDDHETKYVQDAIAMYLPGGDSPFSTSIFSSAVLTNEIQEGTYITVTQRDHGVLPEQKIISFWREDSSKRNTKNNETISREDSETASKTSFA